MTVVIKAGVVGLRIGLFALLVAWSAVSPLIWIRRDGRGADSVDSAGLLAVSKFAVTWGLPALVLVASVGGVSLV